MKSATRWTVEFILWMILLAAAAFYLATALSQRAFADVQPPSDGIEAKLFNSTFALHAYFQDRSAYTCTATAYQKTLTGYMLITAGHCVQDWPAEVHFFVTDEINTTPQDVSLMKAREDEQYDFAVFHLTTNRTYDVIELGNESDYKVGDPVLNVSFANGIGKQLGRGVISSRNLDLTNHCSKECVGKFMVQVSGGPGSSGSMIVSAKTGKSLGVISFGFLPLDIGFAIMPASKYKAFMKLPTQEPHPEIEDDTEKK